MKEMNLRPLKFTANVNKVTFNCITPVGFFTYDKEGDSYTGLFNGCYNPTKMFEAKSREDIESQMNTHYEILVMQMFEPF